MASDLVIFDVCNTLYDSNTTFDFIRFVLQRRYPRRLAAFRLLSYKYSPFFIGWLVAGKLVRKDLVRQRAVGLLKGLHRNELLQLADDFYNTCLLPKRIGEVLQMLGAAQEHAEVWLFSNSVEPVIRTIAEKLGVRYEATELEYDAQGIFTGRISRDMTGRKKDVFLRRFGPDAAIRLMCSDNRSDHAILQLAQERYVVVYHPSDKQFWQQLNPTFIEKF